jgi:putative membrane protein
MILSILFDHVIASVVFSLLGIAVLVITFFIVEKITPQKLWKEVIEKNNTAVAMMASAFIIAMAIIIASAMH